MEDEIAGIPDPEIQQSSEIPFKILKFSSILLYKLNMLVFGAEFAEQEIYEIADICIQQTADCREHLPDQNPVVLDPNLMADRLGMKPNIGVKGIQRGATPRFF